MPLYKAIGLGALGLGIGLNVALVSGWGSQALMIAQSAPTTTVNTPSNQQTSAYTPIPDAVIAEMLKLAGVTRADVVYDLGSGDGRLAIAAVKTYSAQRGVGINPDAGFIQQSQANAQQAGVSDRTQFIQQDPTQADIREASVVNLDALPDTNLKLRTKLLNDLKPGTRIISRTAALGDWKPDKTVAVAGTTLYYWVVPEHIAGDWKGQLEFAPGRSQPYTLRFTQQFQQVKGDVIADGKKYNIPTIALTGDHLTFSRTEVVQGQEGVVQFNGRIEGDTLKGTAGVQWGVLAKNFPIVAKRAGSARNQAMN